MLAVADEIDITPTDPRWVGAWWLGYLVCGFPILMLSIMLFFFPRSMENPKSKTVEEPVDVELSSVEEVRRKNKFVVTFETSYIEIFNVFIRVFEKCPD